MNIDFNTNILTQLITLNDDKVKDIAIKFPQVNDWQNKLRKPTFKQLGDLAKYFNIPFGYFFLENVPVRKYPIPHYRSFNTEPFKPTGELLDTIQTMQQRQQWASSVLKDFQNPLPFAKSISLKTKVEDAAQIIRVILKLPINWTVSEELPTWTDAFKLLINKTEQAGIFVSINGAVDNNTHRTLDINEFRGFVLYDQYAPFIFINGTDFISGKIFTIIHEVVHILIGESASFDFANFVPAHNRIEEYCNAVTAEFLVPKILIEKEFERVDNNYELLARIFKVSRLVIARRLLDLNKINLEEFFNAYNSFKNAESPTITSSGGNFYNTAPYRIGRNFFNLVYNNVKQNKLLYRDAFRLTALSPKSFDGYINEHIIKN